MELSVLILHLVLLCSSFGRAVLYGLILLVSHGSSYCSWEGEWSPGSCKQPKGVQQVCSLLPAHSECAAKTAGMKGRRCDGDSQVRGKDCWVPAAELPPCPQPWFCPGIWHWCLSDPLEACLSFSVAGWDINEQRGRKKTSWKVFYWWHGSRSEQVIFTF